MKRILILKLGALGDVVRTTALLAPLRRRYGADCRVSWVVSAQARPLLRGLGLFRRAVIKAAPPRWLRRERFDLVLSMDEDPAAARWASLAARGELIGAYAAEGAAVRYTPSSAPFFDLGLLNPSRRRADRLKRANRKTCQRLWAEILGLDLARYPLGFEPAVAPTPAEKRAAARALPAGRDWIAVNPGAGARWPSKELSPGRAAALLRLLKAQGREPVLFGGPEEAARNRRILALAGGGRRLQPRGLTHFAALLARCRAVVTTDSLALHLAAAAGKPCAALFGPTSPAEIELYGRGAKLAARRPCSCYYRRRCARRCVDRIALARVVAALELV